MKLVAIVSLLGFSMLVLCKFIKHKTAQIIKDGDEEYSEIYDKL